MNKKNNYRSLVFFFVLLSVIFSNFSSYNNIVTWEIVADRDEYRKLENVTLEYKFSVKNNWHIYSVNPEKSPQFGETAFEYLDSVLIKEKILFLPILKF